MRWWWVRHAPTRTPGAIGWTDAAADLGDTDALDALHGCLPQAPIVASDLARARATADRIAGTRPRLPDERALREINFGAWEGLGFDAVAARFPDDSRAFFDRPGPSRATRGEGFDDLRARVDAAVDRLGAAHRASDDLIAVAHAGTIQAALARAAGLTAAQALAFVIAPLSVTRLDWLADARAWRVSGVNLTLR